MDGEPPAAADAEASRRALVAADSRARRRGRGVLVALVVVVLALGGAWYVSRNHDPVPPPVPADWWVADPSAVTPDSREIEVLLIERSCASGSPAREERIVDHVSYEPDAVVIDIGVRPFSEASCPGNPLTSHVVELDEPLGDRTIEGMRCPDDPILPIDVPRPACEPTVTPG